MAEAQISRRIQWNKQNLRSLLYRPAARSASLTLSVEYAIAWRSEQNNITHITEEEFWSSPHNSWPQRALINYLFGTKCSPPELVGWDWISQVCSSSPLISFLLKVRGHGVCVWVSVHSNTGTESLSIKPSKCFWEELSFFVYSCVQYAVANMLLTQTFFYP